MRVALLVCGMLLAVTPLRGTEVMKMTVSPAQSMAPANLYIRLSIEPKAENRTVVVSAESDDYYRSSEVSLEGEDGPKTVLVQFRSVPGGTYEIRSAVGDVNGRELASAHQNIFVISSGMDK